MLHRILYIQFSPKASPLPHSNAHASCLERGWEAKDSEEERLRLNGPRDTFMLQREMVLPLLFPPPFLSSLASICLLMIFISLAKTRQYFLRARRGTVFGRHKWRSSSRSSRQPWATSAQLVPGPRTSPGRVLHLCFWTSGALCAWEHTEKCKIKRRRALQLGKDRAAMTEA